MTVSKKLPPVEKDATYLLDDIILMIAVLWLRRGDKYETQSVERRREAIPIEDDRVRIQAINFRLDKRVDTDVHCSQFSHFNANYGETFI